MKSKQWRDARGEVAVNKKQALGKYELIPENDALYITLGMLRSKWHAHLAEARIVLAWKDDWQPDPDGRVILGRCAKVADRDKLLHGYDFIILLNRDAVTATEPKMTEDQKRALLDHELCHAEVKRDQEDKLVKDAEGNIKYRVRKHTIEEFHEVVERHGFYKSDIESFVRTAMQSKDAPLLQAQVDADSAAT